MTVKRKNHGRNHSYHVDGEHLPGVTTILGKTVPKPALPRWAARCAADEAVNYREELASLNAMDLHKRLSTAHERDRDAAARRGTEVHRLAEMEADEQDYQVPDELAGHVEAYRDFLDTMGVAPVVGGTELVVASRTHRYCGTADLLADLDRIRVGYRVLPAARWLLDIKTSRSGIFPETALQVCAYANAEVYVHPDNPDHEMPVEGLGIERCAAVWVKSDAWEFRPLDTGPETWAYFQQLRWLYDRVDDLENWVGLSASPADAPALLA